MLMGRSEPYFWQKIYSYCKIDYNFLVLQGTKKHFSPHAIMGKEAAVNKKNYLFQYQNVIHSVR